MVTGISIATDGTVTVTRSVGSDVTASFATGINALIAAAAILDSQIPAGITRDTELAAYAALAGAVFTGVVSGVTPTARRSSGDQGIRGLGCGRCRACYPHQPVSSPESHR